MWLAVNAAALGLAPVHALVVDHALLKGHMAVRVHAHEHQVHPRGAGLLVAASGRDVVAAASASTAARGILCAVQQDRCPLVRWLLLLHAVGYGERMFPVAIGVRSSLLDSLLWARSHKSGVRRESKNSCEPFEILKRLLFISSNDLRQPNRKHTKLAAKPRPTGLMMLGWWVTCGSQFADLCRAAVVDLLAKNLHTIYVNWAAASQQCQPRPPSRNVYLKCI